MFQRVVLQTRKRAGKTIGAMRKLRTLDAVEADYLHDHPDEMEEYMSVIFEEYARDGNTGALLASLRTMSKVKGITTTAHEAGLSRKGLQKALSGGR